MLNVEIMLNENEKYDGYCSPCILVTDDTDLRVPIIFPEDMDVEEAIIATERVKKSILENFKTAEQVKKMIYG